MTTSSRGLDGFAPHSALGQGSRDQRSGQTFAETGNRITVRAASTLAGRAVPWHSRSPSSNISLSSRLMRLRIANRMDQGADHRVCRSRSSSKIASTASRFPASDCVAASISLVGHAAHGGDDHYQSLSRAASRMISTTFRMRVASPTDVPPNFMIRSGFFTGFEGCISIQTYLLPPQSSPTARLSAEAATGLEDRTAEEAGFRSDREYQALCFRRLLTQSESIQVLPREHRDTPIAETGSRDLGSILAGIMRPCPSR